MKSNDWGMVRPQGYGRLVLSACHPLYSASHRWVVLHGRPETPRSGQPIAISPA